MTNHKELIQSLLNEIEKGKNLENLYYKLIKQYYYDKQYVLAETTSLKAISTGLVSKKFKIQLAKLYIINGKVSEAVALLEAEMVKEFDVEYLKILSHCHLMESKKRYSSVITEKKASGSTMRGRVYNYWMETESTQNPEVEPTPFKENLNLIAASKAKILFTLKGNPRQIFTIPSPLENTPLKNPIVQVSCGLHFYMVLDSVGRVFTWGKETSCLLSSNSTILQFKRVSAGAEHCAAISLDDQLYTWGRSSYGKLGLGLTNDKNIGTPTLVTALSRSPVAKVSCFGMNTSVLTHSGDIYTFGRNHRKQLGVENAEFPEHNVPQKSHRLANTYVKPSIKVVPSTFSANLLSFKTSGKFSDLIITGFGEAGSQSVSLHASVLGLFNQSIRKVLSAEKRTESGMIEMNIYDFLAKVAVLSQPYTYHNVDETKVLIRNQLPTPDKATFTQVIEFFYGATHQPDQVSSVEAKCYSTILEAVFTNCGTNNLVKLNLDFVKESALSDFKVVLPNNKTFYLHKAVLYSRSKYFRSLFDSNMKEAVQGEFNFKENNERVAITFFKYLYYDRVVVPDGCEGDDLLSLLDLANQHEEPRLMSILEKLISVSLDLDNAIPMVNFALERNANQLATVATDFIANNKDYLSSEEIIQLPQEQYNIVSKFGTDTETMTVGGQYHPKKITLPNEEDSKVVDIAQGEKMTIALTSNGTLYQLGFGSDKKNQKPLRMINKPKGMGKVTKLSAGSSHAVILTQDSQVYGWGAGFLGQLGVAKSFYTEPTQLSEKNNQVNSVATGHWSTFTWMNSDQSLLLPLEPNSMDVISTFYQNISPDTNPWKALSEAPDTDCTIHIYPMGNGDSDIIPGTLKAMTFSDSSDTQSEKSSKDHQTPSATSHEVIKVHSSILPSLLLAKFKENPEKPILIFGYSVGVVKKLLEFQYTKDITIEGEQFLNLILLSQDTGSCLSHILLSKIKDSCTCTLAINLLKTLYISSNHIKVPFLSKLLLSYLSNHRVEASKTDEYYTLPKEFLSLI